MPLFAYKAVNHTNQVLTGQMEAADATAVARELRAAGQTPLSISEKAADAGSRGGGRGKASLPQSDLIVFLSNLEMLLGAGVDLNTALGSLARSARKGHLKAMISGLHERVQKGESLSDALARSEAAVPGFVVNSLRAGEMGGKLRLSLARLSDHLSRFDKFRSDLLSALIYPAILLVMAVLAIVILVTIVIPQFKPLFENSGAELPLITRIVVGASDFFIDNAAFLLVLLVALTFAIRAVLKDARVGLAADRAKLSLPFGVGLFLKKIELTRFTRLGALLLEGGVPLITALDLARDASGNRAFARAIAEAAEKVREGGRLTSALTATSMLPEVYRDVLEAGEEASQLETVLQRVGEMAERETETALKNLMAVFVPVLTIALGAFVAGVMASVLFALLSANDLIGQQ